MKQKRVLFVLAAQGATAIVTAMALGACANMNKPAPHPTSQESYDPLGGLAGPGANANPADGGSSDASKPTFSSQPGDVQL